MSAISEKLPSRLNFDEAGQTVLYSAVFLLVASLIAVPVLFLFVNSFQLPRNPKTAGWLRPTS